MLIVWILCIIAAIICLRYLYLIIKRCHLLKKLERLVKKQGGTMQYCRAPLTSVFRHDGKTDIRLTVQGRTTELAVVTTPLRRVRYHFDLNDGLLEIRIERRAIYALHPMQKSPGLGIVDRAYTFRRYKMKLQPPDAGNQKYVILNPAPIIVSKADGAKQTALIDNDELIPGVRVCGLKWFVKHGFNEERTGATNPAV